MVEIDGQLHQVFEFTKPKKQNYVILEILGMPVGKNFSVIKLPDDY